LGAGHLGIRNRSFHAAPYQHIRYFSKAKDPGHYAGVHQRVEGDWGIHFLDENMLLQMWFMSKSR
jgi:hypothetical protein